MTVGSVGLDVDFMTSLFVRGTRARGTGLAGVLDLLERGEFDLVGVGRALLADPDWARKVRAGDAASLTAFTPRALASLD